MVSLKQLKRDKKIKALSKGLIALIIVVGLVAFAMYLILRPTKPVFSIQDATVYEFNVSTSANVLSTTLQVTLFSRNPNGRIGIFYSKLNVYAAYRNQQITSPTVLPRTYQGHKDISAWSPFLYGAYVPVSPYTAVLLEQDEVGGSVIVTVKVNGHLKWQVGSWVSGHFQLHVSCPVDMEYIGNNGNTGSILRLAKPVDCTTTI